MPTRKGYHPCRCYADPDCDRCGGSGLVVVRELKTRPVRKHTE